MRCSIGLTLWLTLLALLPAVASAQTIPRAGGGGVPGGAPSSADFLVVDYNPDGSVNAAYIPGIGLIDGQFAASDLEAAIYATFPVSDAADLVALINGDASDSAIAAELLAVAAGFPNEAGFAFISTELMTLIDTGTVLNSTTASFVAEEIANNLTADGFTANEAFAAVRAFMLHKTGNKPRSKIGTFFGQQYIYIETTGGQVYYPTDAEEFVDAIEEIASDGDMIEDLIIKGHGSPTTIDIGDDGDIMTVGNEHVLVGDVNDTTDITETLDNVTDANTDIDLRGCSTAELAEDVNDAIGGDPDVSGAPIPIIGIPWSPWTVGPWYTY